MKTPHAACAALLAVTLPAAGFHLGRHHAPRAPLHLPGSSLPSALASSGNGPSSRLAPLAAAERALARVIAAGHWHPTPEWDALLRALSPADLRVLVPAVAALERRAIREPLLAALLVRWGETAPPDALAWVAQCPDKKQRSALRAALLRGWAHADPDRLLAWLRRAETDPDRPAALADALPLLAQSRPAAACELLEAAPPHLRAGHQRTLFSAWAAHEPHAAAARARTLTDAMSRRRALDAVVTAWSEYDPAAAFAFARTLPPESVPPPRLATCGVGLSDFDLLDLATAETSLRGRALGHLAARDTDAALAAVRALPTAHERDAALRDIARILAPTDPELAGVFALGPPSSPVRSRLLEDVAHAYAAVDPAAALAWARILPEPAARVSAVARIAAQLAHSDPAQALALLTELPSAREHSFQITDVASNWAHRDAPAALAWAQSQRDPRLRQELLAAVAPGWARVDPPAALAHALQLPASEQERFLSHIAHVIAEVAPTSIRDHAHRIAEASARETFLRSAIGTLAFSAPDEAADLLQQFPLRQASHTASQIAQSLATQDPARATAWAARLPVDLQANAADGIARTWAASEPHAAAAWLATLSGAARDRGIRSYIDAVAPTHPELAASLVPTLAHSSQGAEATERFARGWLARDRPAATAWLASAPLPAELRQRLLQR